jgi:hypothetical protein
VDSSQSLAEARSSASAGAPCSATRALGSRVSERSLPVLARVDRVFDGEVLRMRLPQGNLRRKPA